MITAKVAILTTHKHYQQHDGHDVALVSLTDISPQPRSTGIQTTRRSYSANGDVYEQGDYVELIWDAIGSAADYLTLLTAFGLNVALTNDITLYCRDATFAWVRKNGTAVRPEVGRDVKWEHQFPRQVVILVKNLEAAS